MTETILTDEAGNVWIPVGDVFVEDPDSGERFTRKYVERKFGALTNLTEGNRS